MPRGDGTGPNGMGPLTGRGAGFCAGFNAPGYANPTPYGRGFGRGMGRGFRRCFVPVQTVPMQSVQQPVQLSKENEKAMLEDELKLIEDETKAIKDRIAELSSKK